MSILKAPILNALSTIVLKKSCIITLPVDCWTSLVHTDVSTLRIDVKSLESALVAKLPVRQLIYTRSTQISSAYIWIFRLHLLFSGRPPAPWPLLLTRPSLLLSLLRMATIKSSVIWHGTLVNRNFVYSIVHRIQLSSANSVAGSNRM